jgi:succinoglycan biosynthesis transport protein ExoP
MRKLNEEQNVGFRLNIGEYWRIFWRKKYMVLVPLFIAAAVTAVGSRFLIPVYEASTVLRIGDNSEATQQVTPFLQERGGRRSRDAETMAMLETELKSSGLIDELVTQLGMNRDPALREAAERQREALYPEITANELVMRRLRGVISSRINVDRVGPATFRVVYSDANPEACYVLANAMTDLYINIQQRQKITGIQEGGDFVDEQLALYKARLERSENRLEEFQREMSEAVDASNPVRGINIGAAESLDRRLGIEVEEGKNIVAGLEGRLRTHLGGIPDIEELLLDQEVNNLRSDLLAQIEDQINFQLAGAGQTAANDQEIEKTQRNLLNRVGELIRIKYPDVNRDVHPLIDEYVYQMIHQATRERKMEKLRRYIASYRASVEMRPHWDSELAKLRADVEADRDLYNQFRSSKTSSQINEAVQSTNLAESVTILEQAVRPLQPVRPNKMKLLGLAIFFGLSLGVVGVLFTELSDSSYRSVDEIERELGFKVLGTVPRFERSGAWHGENRVKKAVTWVTVSVLVVVVSLMGFYFYGKSSREQMVNVNVSRSVEGK